MVKLLETSGDGAGEGGCGGEVVGRWWWMK